MSSRINRARNLRARVNVSLAGVIAAEGVEEADVAAIVKTVTDGAEIKAGELITYEGEIYTVGEDQTFRAEKLNNGNGNAYGLKKAKKDKSNNGNGGSNNGNGNGNGNGGSVEPSEPPVEPSEPIEPETPSVALWVQPKNKNHGAYSIGDRVLYGANVYESDIDENIFEPNDRGWHIVEESED